MADFADTNLETTSKVLTTGDLIKLLADYPIDTPVSGEQMNELVIRAYSDHVHPGKKLLMFDENTQPRIVYTASKPRARKR